MPDTMSLYEAEELFSLPDPYTKDDVKSAYRKLIVEKHPDVRKDVDAETANREASEINTANKLLSSRFDGTEPGMSYSRQNEPRVRVPMENAQDMRRRQSSNADPASSPVREWERSYVQGDYSVPYENVTWEDLAEDFWEAFHEDSIRRMRQSAYSYEDMRRDDAVAIFEHLSKGVARHVDQGTRINTDSSSKSERAGFERQYSSSMRKKRQIDKWTGRIAVLFYVAVFALLTFALLFVSPFSFLFLGPLLVLCVLSAIVNVFFPFVSVRLRRFAYKHVDFS